MKYVHLCDKCLLAESPIMIDLTVNMTLSNPPEKCSVDNKDLNNTATTSVSDMYHFSG
jgi:hypothetical protein